MSEIEMLRAENERLKTDLASETRWANEYHDEWQKAEMKMREALEFAESSRRGAINWREEAWRCGRALRAAGMPVPYELAPPALEVSR